jgi:hypothetical protein
MIPQNKINIILATGIVIIILLLLLRNEKTTQTQPINYELLDYVYKETRADIEKLKSQIKNRENEITKDSLITFSSDRNHRDSLRAIHNPR